MEFTWVPDKGLTCSIITRVKGIAFGDGYEQRVGDGINTVIESWSPNFTLRTRAEINAIDAFLRLHGGVLSFDWLSPGGIMKRFKCPTWSPVYNHDGDCSLSATFQQVFEN